MVAARPGVFDRSAPAGRPSRAAIGALGIGIVSIALFAASPRAATYWSALPSIVAFALTQAVLPTVAARVRYPLCPHNWVLLLFCFQLVIDPLLLCWLGPVRNTLPLLPDPNAINVAQCVVLLAWFGFVIGAHLAATSAATPRAFVGRLAALRRPVFTAPTMIVAFAVLGIIGLALAFHSPHALLAYFKRATGHVGISNTAGQSGLVKTASVLLRPFLTAAFLIPWLLWLERRPSRGKVVFASILVAIPVLVTSATYSYNRASVLAPLIAMTAVFGAKVKRVGFLVLAIAAFSGLFVATFARAYRNTNVAITQVATNSAARHAVLRKVDLNQEIQIYTSAPQFLGFLLSRTQYGREPRYGRTIVSSIMSPVPVLGKPFRSTSGEGVYNHLIYGNATTRDQVAPFEGELFLDFTFPGVLLGFAIVGFVVGRLQQTFERAHSAFAAFVWQYAAIWIGFLVIGSIAVTSQITIYFFWPFIVFALLAKPHSSGSRPNGGDSAGSATVAVENDPHVLPPLTAAGSVGPPATFENSRD